MFLSLSVFLALLFISYGYAVLNTELSISGDAYVKADIDVRITDIKVKTMGNEAFETYNSKYTKDTTSMFVTLPNENSNITYEVTIQNKTGNSIQITDIIEENKSNSNIGYTINGIEKYGVYNDDEIKFTITFTNNTDDYQEEILKLNYLLEPCHPIPPPILKLSGITVSIKSQEEIFSGLSYYEYYVTDTNIKPSENITPTGITDNKVKIANDTITYVYYRAVSNNGEKSDWSIPIKFDPKSFSNILLSNYEIIESEPNLKTSSNKAKENGMYVSYDTDSGDPTYYYRGNITNNYVSFAGFTWRIVRINEDNTIRLILETGINNKTYLYNNYSGENVVNLLYYDNSNARLELEKWYEDKLINYDDIIVSADYCEAFKVKWGEQYTSGNAEPIFFLNYTPTYKCQTDGNGHGKLSLKIGLLDYDEAMFAGGCTYETNTTYYLYNGNSVWLMSPSGILPNNHPSTWIISSNYSVSCSGFTALLPLRAVINLKSDIVVTGTGTKSDPYVIN